MIPVLIGMPSRPAAPRRRARCCAPPARARSSTRTDACTATSAISLTDRCSLRCTYCMPEQGNEWLARSSILTLDEIVRIATVAAAAGITTFRLTGGEPLLRTDIVEVVRRLAAIDGPDGRPVEIAMTTNGIRLPELLPGLDRGGPRPAQHLDRHARPRAVPRPHAPRPARRRARGDRGGRGIRSASSQAQRGRDARGQRRRARRPRRSSPSTTTPQMRFIEQMPLDAGHTWSRDHMVTRDEILERALGALDADPGAGTRGSARRTLDARRRPAHRRRHRVGHGAVLRRLRPPPAHRRRPAAQLPLLDDRVRPAADPARRGRRR